jgi:iron(III) transport system permease protein
VVQPRALNAPRSASAVALVATALALVPLLDLAVQAGAAGWGRVTEVLVDSDVAVLALRSVGLAVSVGLIAGVVGTTTAWLVERSDLPAPSVWHVLVVLPLAVPSYVAAYAWVSWWPAIASIGGAVLVLTFATVPLVHLYVAAVLRTLDPAQDEVARSLGKRPGAVLLQLTVPQVRRGSARAACWGSWPARSAGAFAPPPPRR